MATASTSFTLWKYKDLNLGAWQDNLTEVGSGDSRRIMELHGGILSRVSDLPAKEDVCIFRKDVTPMWEDHKNQNGGRWTVWEKKPLVLEEMYLRSIMAFFNRAFVDDDPWSLVNGVYLQRRRLALWTTNIPTLERIRRVGCAWKDVIGMDHVVLEYESHKGDIHLTIDTNSM